MERTWTSIHISQKLFSPPKKKIAILSEKNILLIEELEKKLKPNTPKALIPSPARFPINQFNINMNHLININADKENEKNNFLPPLPYNNYFESFNKTKDSQNLTKIPTNYSQKENETSPKNDFATPNKFTGKKNEREIPKRRSIKNNKMVFLNKNINNPLSNDMLSTAEEDFWRPDNTYSNFDENQFELKIEELNQKSSKKSDKTARASKFRGVSKNGNQWQVLIMVNKKKRYVGSFSEEEEAARYYDRAAIQNHGNKAKTNFFYSEKQIKKILAFRSILNMDEWALSYNYFYFKL